jgi:hypothetical protein
MDLRRRAYPDNFDAKDMAFDNIVTQFQAMVSEKMSHIR